MSPNGTVHLKFTFSCTVHLRIVLEPANPPRTQHTKDQTSVDQRPYHSVLPPSNCSEFPLQSSGFLICFRPIHHTQSLI